MVKPPQNHSLGYAQIPIVSLEELTLSSLSPDTLGKCSESVVTPQGPQRLKEVA